MAEFEIIAKYFRPLTQGRAETSGLQDDAAVLEIPPGYELVITSDTLNAGTHFLENEDPANIAHKALRVNLSDLAAMGADPFCYQLNLAFPKPPTDAWLTAFSTALAADQKEFNIFCSGGDTTSIKSDYLSISITALGLVPKGTALYRHGAKEGDKIILSGPIGDAYLGLKALRQNLKYKNVIDRYRKPVPRIKYTVILRQCVNAAADISDGFVADLGHIANASNLSAEVHLKNFKFSKEVQHAIDMKILTPQDVLTGGDDYELILAVPPENEAILVSTLKQTGLNAYTIGTFKPGNGVRVLDEKGKPLAFKSKGWTHF